VNTPNPTRPQTLSHYIELRDAAAARTQKLCTDQPQQAAVRTALLRAEKQVHQEHGWDGPPKVFFLQQHAKTGRIRYTEFEKFSLMLVALPGRPTDILAKLASVTEFTRAQAHVAEDELDPLMRDLPPEFHAMMERARRNPDADLFDCSGEHWHFHGVGVIIEAWMVLDPSPETQTMAHNRQLHTHPERIEIRELYYAARDGWMWDLTRLRRTPTIAVPRHCVVLHHDNDHRVVGTVPHALTRMCNAISSNPVRIAPATHPRTPVTPRQ
jgi:hypothetical protein